MARLHLISDAWGPPASFQRCAWDLDGLLGEEPLWGRFWENPALSGTESGLYLDFRRQATADLARHALQLDYGLLHADLVSANVLVDGANLALIDFDDGGFGFRLFELATSLVKHHAEPEFANLRCALIAGYQAVRPLDVRKLDLFLAIRAASYVGWNISRIDEAGAATRNQRFINTANSLIRAYLGRAV